MCGETLTDHSKLFWWTMSIIVGQLSEIYSWILLSQLSLSGIMSSVLGSKWKLNISSFQFCEYPTVTAHHGHHQTHLYAVQKTFWLLLSSQITADASKNGCWQRTGNWANWIYRTANEGGWHTGMGRGAQEGECGLLGRSLDRYAVQKGGDRRESISKWCKRSSSGEGETSWD